MKSHRLNFIQVPCSGSGYGYQYYGSVDGEVHYCRHQHLNQYGAMRCAERHFENVKEVVKDYDRYKE
jgi:hypothetical protein